MGAGNSAVVVDLPRWGPMLSPRVPNLVPIPGPRMERETPGQRPRPNYGHPQGSLRDRGLQGVRLVISDAHRGLAAAAGCHFQGAGPRAKTSDHADTPPPTTTRLTTRCPFDSPERPAAMASSTNTNMPPDQPRHHFGHPQAQDADGSGC